ncbi:ribosomal protein S18-alanine N-acetyltransferase [Halodesulfurarchaeum sp.]|uniref:ribosomal protein S18-alanine N-acetyltransferase n=1 Tax=Halodesulfurarchaeum sp. TaxID=1980530 RepID=UPI001BC74EC3|nr:ribosomal protein S18-alanine N-acetyltransferase [Halodesulfurarchaeum sp.]
MTVEEPQPRGRLRPVERADLLAVVRIEEQTFERPWTLSTFEKFLDAQGFIVLEDPEGEALGEAIAGYVVAELVTVRGSQFGHVKDLAVKPARQGAGRGRQLLEGALRLLASHGAKRVRLEVRPSNTRALSLYKNAGFEILARQEQYYPDGEDALLLARSLEGFSKS